MGVQLPLHPPLHLKRIYIMMGYTPGGSPILNGPISTRSRTKSGQERISCSVDPRHKTTRSLAKKNGGVCVQCKAWLANSVPTEKERNHYLRQIEFMKRKLEYLDSMKENE